MLLAELWAVRGRSTAAESSWIPFKLSNMAGCEVGGRSSMCARKASSKVLGDSGTLPPDGEVSVPDAEYGTALKVK